MMESMVVSSTIHISIQENPWGGDNLVSSHEQTSFLLVFFKVWDTKELFQQQISQPIPIGELHSNTIHKHINLHWVKSCKI